jgi:hypothetical protein
MADDDDQFDDDGNPIEPPKKTPGAIMREKLETALRENAELKKERETIALERKQGQISKLLRDVELDEDIAEYVARDIPGEVNETSFAAWLETKGKRFGYQKPEPLTEEQQYVAEQAARVSAATANASPPPPGLTVELLKSLSHKDLIQRGYINADD